MQKTRRSPTRQQLKTGHSRRGNVVVLSTAFFVVILAFTAFVVDIGYIALTKAKLQNAADAAALGAVLELPQGYGLGAEITQSETEAAARQTAVDVAAANPAGELDSIYADGQRDVRLGQIVWDTTAQDWAVLWNTQPYNLVEVTLHRDQAYEDPDVDQPVPNTAGDRPLDLYFAPVIGHETANVAAASRAAMLAGGGFRIRTGSGLTVGVLPITLDEPTWKDVLNGIGTDDWAYDPDTETISPGSDGVHETNLYPQGPSELPPGNRGTVDIGGPNNSTADLTRQILYGLNEYDLSFFGGELSFDQGPLSINGDTGLSAGIEDELESIKGLPRAIPIFTEVSGPGNNATYTVVKFVGIRVLDVQLSGSPSKKHVTIQPAPFSDSTVVYSESVTLESDTIFTQPVLVQ